MRTLNFSKQFGVVRQLSSQLPLVKNLNGGNVHFGVGMESMFFSNKLCIAKDGEFDFVLSYLVRGWHVRSNVELTGGPLLARPS